VRDFEDAETFEVWVRIQFGNGHDQLKMHVLNTLFAAGEGLTSKQYGFVTGTVLTVEDVVEPGFWDLVSHAKISWRLFTHNFTLVCTTRLHGFRALTIDKRGRITRREPVIGSGRLWKWLLKSILEEIARISFDRWGFLTGLFAVILAGTGGHNLGVGQLRDRIQRD
jgi:hypothetical protein